MKKLDLEKTSRNYIPSVSIIIPTYNRAKCLPVTIESFIKQDYPIHGFEIIIVDNNSIDETKKISCYYKRKYPGIVKYLFEKRQGVHYARNSGAKISKGEILYFTDDDMIATPNLISELTKLFILYPQVACATGLILPKFEKKPAEWVRRCLWNQYLSLTEKSRPEQIIVTEKDLVYSCHQAVRRDIFIKAGGFNPENTAGIWVGDGETGLNNKIKQMGYKFGYTPKSIIYHIIPMKRTTIKYLIERMGNQGFCDSYSDYRKHRDRDKIIPLMLKRNTLGLLKLMVLTFIKIANGKNSWHFIPANIMYAHKRNVYDVTLYFKKTFRDIVEIDDWINTSRDIQKMKHFLE